MKQPEDSTVLSEDGAEDTNKVAADVIDLLDEGYSRADVVKIAEWIHYLSTQD